METNITKKCFKKVKGINVMEKIPTIENKINYIFIYIQASLNKMAF